MKPVAIAGRLTALLLSVAVAACALEGPRPHPPAAPRGLPDPDATQVDGRRATCFGPQGDSNRATPAPPPTFALHVPGFPDAIVAEPLDTRPSRPVVVALHGLGGRPEPHCDGWRNITQGTSFVLCPRGDDDPQRSTQNDRRYTLAGGERLRVHVDIALRALADRFGDRADIARPLLAGFSLGATEAALLAQSDPARFPVVVLLEGGVDQWQFGNIDSFRSRGGQRVLFGCGSGWCTPPARAASGRIELLGLRSRTVRANVGHTNAPALQTAVREELGWLLSDDPRWSSPPEPPQAAEALASE